MCGKIINTTECCKVGSYAHQVPMVINGKVRGIDYCIADIVAAINTTKLSTVASCCGHGGQCPARIDLEDGRVLHIEFPDNWKSNG